MMSISLGWGFILTAFALAIGLLHGGTLSILQVDMAFRYDGHILIVNVDPVFVLHDVDLRKFLGESAIAAAGYNVILLSAAAYDGSDPEWEAAIIEHELIHVYQQRATGIFWPLIRLGVAAEGTPVQGLWGTAWLRARNRTMWVPPRPGWPNLAPILMIRI